MHEISGMNVQLLFEKKSNFITKKTGEDLLLVPLKTNADNASDFITLNAVGAFIWENWSATDTLDTIVQQVLREFDADEATVKMDVQDFFTMLEPILNGTNKE